MDNKYLNKVLDQLVSETRIDKNRGVIESPFFYSLYSSLRTSFPVLFLSSLPSFSDHCKDVYGLNDDEVKYIWNEYKHIIKDMSPL